MFVTKLKYVMLFILMMAVLATAAVLTHQALTAAPPPSPKADAAPASTKVPRLLLEKRLDAAQKVFTQHMQRYRGGQGLPSELYGWSERWLEAEMALSDQKADHVAALEAHLARTREVERLAVADVRTGRGRQADADAASYDRLNAEIRLFRATGKVPPPGADSKPLPAKGPAQVPTKKDR